MGGTDRDASRRWERADAAAGHPPVSFVPLRRGMSPAMPSMKTSTSWPFWMHRPLNPGHVLVVPKRHEPDFHRLASALLARRHALAHRLGKCLAHLYQPPKVGLFVIGFHVPHVHVHVVPLYAMADMTAEAFERAQRTSPAVAVLVASAAQIRHALAVMEDDDTPASGWHA